MCGSLTHLIATACGSIFGPQIALARRRDPFNPDASLATETLKICDYRVLEFFSQGPFGLALGAYQTQSLCDQEFSFWVLPRWCSSQRVEPSRTASDRHCHRRCGTGPEATLAGTSAPGYGRPPSAISSARRSTATSSIFHRSSQVARSATISRATAGCSASNWMPAQLAPTAQTPAWPPPT